MVASIYKPGEFFRKNQLQGIANKQTTSEEVIVDVTGEEENEERSFEDLENDIADNDRGRPQKNARKPQQHKTRAKKRPKKFSWTPEKAEDLCLRRGLRSSVTTPSVVCSWLYKGEGAPTLRKLFI